MNYGMYVSAAGALANSYRQDVVANNLANVETVAFKPDLAMFQARRTQAQTKGQRFHTTAMLEGIGGGIFALPTYTDFSPASLDQTGSPFDLALTGKGFFQVNNPDAPGGISFTRDGRFTHNENNQLVTVAGKLPVLDDKGQPIVINPDIQSFVVDETGFISQDQNPVARLGVVDFDDSRVLRKRGQSLYVVPQGVQPRPVESRIKQGALENSGVNSLKQLAEMIKTQRLFQSNINMMLLQDQSLGLAVTRLGNING